MKSKKTSLLAIATISVVGLGALYYTGGGAAACEAMDGKWASSTGRCITRACYQSQSCGEWASPGARCTRLRVGDTRAEVYFQLGMPREAAVGFAEWDDGKGDTRRIVARFSKDALTSLSCPMQ